MRDLPRTRLSEAIAIGGESLHLTSTSATVAKRLPANSHYPRIMTRSVTLLLATSVARVSSVT